MFSIIETRQIDFSDMTFCVSFPLESPAVSASVGMVGVINPIIVSGCPCQGKYQLVAGFRRAFACRDIGLAQIPAQIYPVDPDNPLAAFCLALYENLAHRTFNAVECAEILRKLSAQFHCPADELAQTFLPALGLPRSAKTLDAYLRLAAFDDEQKRHLAGQELPLGLIELLAALPPEDRGAAFRLMTAVNINQNKLRELLTMAEDIALRDGCALRDVLSDPAILSLLAHEKFSAPQKLDAIRDALRRRRFPRLTALEQEYAAALKRLKSPQGVQLTADRYFEDDALTATFRFASRDQLAAVADELRQFAVQPELETLLRVIQGQSQ